MHNRREAKPDGVRIFLWRGTVPALLALLVMAPLLFVFLSVAAMLVAGGVLGALVLPWFLGRGARGPRDTREIELGRDQYRRVDSDAPKLPRR